MQAAKRTRGQSAVVNITGVREGVAVFAQQASHCIPARQVMRRRVLSQSPRKSSVPVRNTLYSNAVHTQPIARPAIKV